MDPVAAKLLFKFVATFVVELSNVCCLMYCVDPVDKKLLFKFVATFVVELSNVCCLMY